MSTDKTLALVLADELAAVVQTYPQTSEDEPGGYCQPEDRLMDDAATELRRLAEVERESALLRNIAAEHGLQALCEPGSAVEGLASQLDEARAEIARITEAGRAHIRRAAQFEAERDELQAQLKAVQADALRYRWLRDHACTVQANSIGPIYRIDVQITAGARSLSSSIDAAMGGKEQA